MPIGINLRRKEALGGVQGCPEVFSGAQLSAGNSREFKAGYNPHFD